MAKIGPFSDNLPLRLGTELSCGQPPSVEYRVYSSISVWFIKDMRFESVAETVVYNPHEG